MNKEETEKLKEDAISSIEAFENSLTPTEGLWKDVALEAMARQIVSLTNKLTVTRMMGVNNFEVSETDEMGVTSIPESDDVKHWRGVAEDYIAKYENSVLRLKELVQFNTDNAKLREDVQRLNIKLAKAHDDGRLSKEAINYKNESIKRLRLEVQSLTAKLYEPTLPPAPAFAVGDIVECDIVGRITRMQGDIALIDTGSGDVGPARRDIRLLKKIEFKVNDYVYLDRVGNGIITSIEPNGWCHLKLVNGSTAYCGIKGLKHVDQAKPQLNVELKVGDRVLFNKNLSGFVSSINCNVVRILDDTGYFWDRNINEIEPWPFQ